MRHGLGTNRVDSGTDPDRDLDPESIFPLFHHGETLNRMRSGGHREMEQSTRFWD